MSAFMEMPTQTLKAQTNYLPLGTWKYINGNDTIEIYLKSTQINLADTRT